MVTGSDQENIVRGVVRALEGQAALVEVAQGCGRCHEKGGCGGQHLTQMLCSGPKLYRADNVAGAQIGETVEIAIAAGSVSRSANLAYGLPLFGFIAGAVFGMQFAGDSGAVAGGGLGLAIAWILLRMKLSSGTGNPEFRPYIVFRSH